MPRQYTRIPFEQRFWSKVDRGDPADPNCCWLWTAGTYRRGYGMTNTGGRDGRNVRSHRVAWELTYGPIPPGLLVCHHCDTPRCVNPEHLFLGTSADNTHDMIKKGRANNCARMHPERMARGERNGLSKLNGEQVREIRLRYSTLTITQAALAREYLVSKGHITKIVHRHIWKHI